MRKLYEDVKDEDIIRRVTEGSRMSNGVMNQIGEIHSFLKKNGPWPGYGTDLAAKLGMPYVEFRYCIDTVRSPWWIEKYGWTIPYVGHGQGRKNAYAVVDAKAAAVAYLSPGTQIRSREVLSILRRLDGQFDLGAVLLDQRTAEGKFNRNAAAQFKAMISMAEALGL